MHSRTAALSAALCLALSASACGAGSNEVEHRRSPKSTTAEQADAAESPTPAPETTLPTSTSALESQVRVIEGLGKRRVQACLLADSNRNNLELYADQYSSDDLKSQAAQTMAIAERLSEFDDGAANYLRQVAGTLEAQSEPSTDGQPVAISLALASLDSTPFLAWLTGRCSFIYRPQDPRSGGYEDACSGGEWRDLDDVTDRIINSPDCRLYLRDSSTLCDVRIEEAEFDEALRVAGAPDGVAVDRPSCWGRALVLRTYRSDGLMEEGRLPPGALVGAYVGTYVLLLSASEAPTKVGEWMSGQLSPSIPDPTTLPVTVAEADFISLEMI